MIDWSIAVTNDQKSNVVNAVSPLWRMIGTGAGHGNGLGMHYNEYLRDFANRIKVDHLLDEQAFTNHLFRKIIARLVALALVNAPKILMDIFGHRTIEMTLHYILNNKTIQAEVKQIQKALLGMVVEGYKKR